MIFSSKKDEIRKIRKKIRFFLHHKILHRNLVPQFNSFPKKFFERIVFIKTSGETGSTKLGQPATKNRARCQLLPNQKIWKYKNRALCYQFVSTNFCIFFQRCRTRLRFRLFLIHNTHDVLCMTLVVDCCVSQPPFVCP